MSSKAAARVTTFRFDQMAAMMRNEGVIVANDFSADRAKPLGLNLQRCGVMNTIITP